ncbi:MAG: hypothetical protein ACJATT_005459 [Myxococcota bacterium]
MRDPIGQVFAMTVCSGLHSLSLRRIYGPAQRVGSAMAKRPLFEILDEVDTPLGVFTLRRRDLLRRPGVIVTEVNVGHELLMSSLNSVSEEALSHRAVAWHGGTGLRALVGGLGLGYTAQAAIDTGAVTDCRVVERVAAVIDWVSTGLVPLSESLMGDARVQLVEGDVYAELLGPASEGWDLILIDVDHSPTETLGPVSAPFYTAAGLRRVAEHLNPGGVLAVWSVSDDDAFATALSQTFAEETRQKITWVNELINGGTEVEDFLFLARKGTVLAEG